MSLTSRQISQINRGYLDAKIELIETTPKMSSFCAGIEVENKNAYEYGFYGILRRLFLVRNQLQKQIDELRDYEPNYMHSFNQVSKMVRFHPQAIADFRSLCVLVNIFLNSP